MKKFMLKLILLFLVDSALCAVEQVRDPYQDVAPELVKKVDLAKQKQIDRTDLKQAESLLTDVLKQKPDYYRALYNLGQLYDSEGDYEKAIQTLKKAEAVRYAENIPDNSILTSLGWAYLNAGNLDKAEDYLKKAYATRAENTASTNNRILYNLGWLYLKKGQPEEARKYLTEAIDKFHSIDAPNILKLVNDYEQRQDKSEPSEERWAVYGEQAKAGRNWTERHFSVQGGNKTSVPKPNDTVIAIDKVTVRSRAPVWDSEIQDYIVGPEAGYIKPGDRVRVLQVLDANPNPTDPNAYYFIRLSRLPKE
jgi:tetratricopeptide (TPR) repeat protein